MTPEQERQLDALLAYGRKLSDKAVREIFPRPSQMAVGLLNLSGRDTDEDGGFQRALQAKGLKANFDPHNLSWEIVGARPE